MENDTKLQIRKMMLQEKASLIQIIDLYGADTIIQQFIMHLPEHGQIGRLTGIILELNEQLWVRSLPHAPGNIITVEKSLEYYPDKLSHIIFDRYVLGPGGVPTPRGGPQDSPENIFKNIIQGQLKIPEPEGIFVKLWRRIFRKPKEEFYKRLDEMRKEYPLWLDSWILSYLMSLQ